MNIASKIYIHLIILFALCICTFSSVKSTEAKEEENLGVIVISHGAPMPAWNDGVLDLIKSVKSPYPLEVAFLDYDAEKTLKKSIKRLEDKGIQEILLVHLSPSSYSEHHEEIKYLIGIRNNLGIYTEEADPPIKSIVTKFVVSPCMDNHPLVTDILADYVRELSQDPEKESLILLGHGPIEELMNIMWVKQLKNIGREIQKRIRFREIVCMTLRNDSADLIREQAAEDLREVAKRLSDYGRVIVVVNALGAMMVQQEAQRILQGIPSVVISTKGVASHPKAVEWIEDTINKGINQSDVEPVNRSWSHYDYETGKPIGTHRHGFL